MKHHNYKLTVEWTGNIGTGTSNYKAYERSYSILVENKVNILGSSDPAYHGDEKKHNPEDLLLASVASCHMLWYLHLCAEANIVVIDYTDNTMGVMVETANGSGKFTEITLNPVVTITDHSMIAEANELHKKANELCFIANSLNIPILHIPVCKTEDK